MEQNDFELVETGDWEEIIRFCHRVSTSIQGEVADDIHDRFEEWRPRPDESERTLREKTAEDASIHETQIEKTSNGTAQELSSAGKEVKQGGKDMVNGNPRESVKEVEQAGNSAAKGFIPPVLRLFRTIEKLLYTNIMGKTSPNYFESDEFTVALERRLTDRSTYKVRIICEDTSLLDTLEEALQSDETDEHNDSVQQDAEPLTDDA